MKLLPYIAQEYSRPSQCGQNIQPCGLVHQMLHSAPMVTHTPAPGSFKVATDSAWEFSDWQKKKKKNVGAKKKKVQSAQSREGITILLTLLTRFLGKTMTFTVHISTPLGLCCFV